MNGELFSHVIALRGPVLCQSAPHIPYPSLSIGRGRGRGGPWSVQMNAGGCSPAQLPHWDDGGVRLGVWMSTSDGTAAQGWAQVCLMSRLDFFAALPSGLESDIDRLSASMHDRPARNRWSMQIECTLARTSISIPHHDSCVWATRKRRLVPEGKHRTLFLMRFSLGAIHRVHALQACRIHSRGPNRARD